MGVANFSASDVLVGAANLLIAPKGTAIPDETTVPINTFGSWASGWVHLGYTQDAPTFTYNYETFEVLAQESTAPLRRSKVNETLQISTNLLQFSGAHLAYVTGGTLSQTAAGASQKAYDRIITGGATNLPEHM